MMKLVKIITILLFTFYFAYADVKLDAKSTFVKGEAYTFKIIATGKDIQFANIEKIDNQPVDVISTQNVVNIINSKMQKKIIKVFRFFPTSSFTIPSFNFTIDNKQYKTDSKKVEQKELKKSNLSYADFEISTSKSSVYVAQGFKLKVKFKYLEELNVQDLSISNADFKDFWYKQTDNSKQYKEDGFIVNELEFLLFAQKSGKLRIEPFKIIMKLLDLNSSSFFNSSYSTRQIYSNSLTIDVKPLPENINLMGDFNIKTSIDNLSINQGDAVSYKVEVSGYGNIDDIKDFKLQIEDAQVFENKPKIDTKIENGKLYGTYEKSFSIVPSKTIDIKPLTLKYFDAKTKKVITKKTKSYKINVKQKSSKRPELLTAKQTEVVKKEIIKSSIKDRIIFFLLGCVFALLIVYLYNYVINKRFKKQKESNLLTKIKTSKTASELIKVLAFMIKKDDNLDKLIFKLQNIDNIHEFKSIKKEIYLLVKEIEKGKK